MSHASLTDLEGVLLIDKPVGPTSHDVVDRLRRTLAMKRIGHAGTLDPMATGLLIMLIGKATKASQFLLSQDKEYEGTFELGKETNTQDREGEVVSELPVPPLTETEIQELMNGFLGDQYQTPPMHSAVKVKGVPLYKLARKGKTVEREPRFIRIKQFRLKGFESPMVHFYLACSKGTYVRALAHDLGRKVGCGGHLAALRRTATGKFSVEEAIALDDVQHMTREEIRLKLIPVREAVPPQVI